MIHNNTTYKILHDPGLGSVRYVIEPTTQQIIQEIEYDEFGNMMKNSNPDFQPILFSGGLYDFDTKLYRFGARDYDPTVGRWTSKDPIGFAGGDTNLYAYVGGNPMSYVDPSGHFGVVGGTVGFINGAIGGYTAGGFWGGVVGSVAGGVTGIAFPASSGVAGAAAAGALSNVFGQVLGNGLSGNSLGLIDLGQTIASGFAAATGGATAAALRASSVAGQTAVAVGSDGFANMITSPFHTGPIDFCRVATGKTCTLNQICGGH